ncbi:hypothetical protein [Mesobacillus subterraneus]|uniref:Uncharacterized protein n=1 Tax=Mesobacillus subterraneus TaxID=285983 RepID=A0A0D6ZB13_9BACI|nr:hypothetical protein [Mesobacillus subterraneus]KIY22530.1 hypothetical protein UB32_08055 [Mesobacillus subterraneus]
MGKSKKHPPFRAVSMHFSSLAGETQSNITKIIILSANVEEVEETWTAFTGKAGKLSELVPTSDNI